MNSVILKGRLTKDPVANDRNGTVVCNFSLAVSRKYNREEADFINCVAFNKTATFIASYFSKGSEMCVNGSLRTSSYENEKGKQYRTEVVIDSVEFCGKRADGAKSNSGDDYELEPIDSDDIPF